jgi:hypothetical protein
MEERAGERRSFSLQAVELPRSSILTPLLVRGARKKTCQQVFAQLARTFIIVIPIEAAMNPPGSNLLNRA